MKPKNFSGKIKNHSTIFWYGCAAACCALSLQTVAAEDKAPAAAAAAAAPSTATNWIGFTIGGAFVSGDDASMQRRTNTNGDFYGGIESMQFSQALNDSTTLTIEGHALPGLEDYAANVTLEKNSLGFVKLGYKEFRTWYDGSGGLVPGNAASWVPLYEDELSVDRGQVSFEAGLRMENIPEITFGYTHAWRNGTKDSTSWGGIPSANGSYKTIPALTQIDEQIDTFRLDATHTLGNTYFGGGLSYQSIKNDDTRVMRNGDQKSIIPTGNTVSDTAAYDADIFNAHLFSETRFGERLLLSFGYSYTNLDTNIGGDRPSVATSNPGVPLTASDHALYGITGGTQDTLNVLNANLWWNPIDDLVIVPSLRAEFEDMSGWSHHIAGIRGNPNATQAELDNALAGIGLLPYGPKLLGTPATIPSFVPTLSSDSDTTSNEVQEFTESLEARYTGVSDILFYGKAEFSQIEGDMRRTGSVTERDVTTQPTVPGTSTDYHTRTVDSDVDIQKYTIGANWYPLSGLSVSTQVFYRNYDQTFANILTGGDDAQLRQHNNETADANIRLTWRALSNLTFVTRYDYQQTYIENQAFYDATATLGTGLIESADITKHILSESVTWSPIERCYVQGSVSFVHSETATPASGGPNAVVPGLMPNWDNDYISASLNVGYVLDDQTDITATYSFYGASNYNATGAIGYGMDTQEHGVSVTLTRLLTQNVIWNLRYAFITSNTDMPDQTGGNNDFDAHMISTGLQIRF
jgi:hypothetical protein